ncbi:MAG: glycan-binding surface protein [Bacteroidota bacterium]
MSQRLSSRLVFSVLFLAGAMLASGCVQFLPAALYSGVEQAPVPERPRTLALAAEPVIFSDQTDDTVWFQDDVRCTQGEVTSDVVYAGQRAVALSWDRNVEGCEWAGFGIGWDGWAGKDLSELLPYAAIEMQVRTKEGTMYGLPIVLTFEDYAGGMGFSYTGNRYFERPVIDEDWQKIVVPLASFDLEVENLDLTNVKQLMFELQGSGSIYIDDVRLAFYEEEEQEPWLVEAPRPDPTALPIQLFGDAFINDNGWGLVSDRCQTVETTTASASEGSTALHLRWDLGPDECYQGSMGVSWDQWYPIDMTDVVEQTAVQFDVRVPEGAARTLPLRFGFEDYGRQFSGATLDGSYTASGQFTMAWQTVTIPLTHLRGGGTQLAAAPATVGNLPEPQGRADWSNVKQLIIYMDEAGEVLLDNIRLVEIN